jgi:hypothetical protein
MNRRLWTAEELAIVRELYPHRPTLEIAERLGRGRTVDKVHAIANKLGVHKTARSSSRSFVVSAPVRRSARLTASRRVTCRRTRARVGLAMGPGG